MHGLMLAFAFGLPYHVLRTATASGVRVHVLGRGPSRGLRASRHCTSYRLSAVDGSGDDDAETILAEIEEICRRRRIDVVFPSDDVSTRLLAAIADRLPVRSSPLPDLTTFDLLNDKWNFTRLAQEHGVRVPQGWLYDGPDALRRDILRGARHLPLTVKPTNMSGSRGVLHIRQQSELSQLDEVDYRPVLAQQHILGETVGISAICRDGEVVAQAAQRRDDRCFQLFASPDLADNVRRLAAATRLNGPANFDAVIEEKTGLAYIVECNPRFWFTIYMSMLVGINFLAHALSEPGSPSPEPASLDRGELNLGMKDLLSAPRQASAADWAYAAYNLSDPLVYLLLRRNFFDDRHIAVTTAQMQPYRPAQSSPAEPSRAFGT